MKTKYCALIFFVACCLPMIMSVVLMIDIPLVYRRQNSKWMGPTSAVYLAGGGVGSCLTAMVMLRLFGDKVFVSEDERA